MSLKVCTDYGSVTLTKELEKAIELIFESAFTLQMTAQEFIGLFEEGIPDCPVCNEGSAHVKEH